MTNRTVILRLALAGSGALVLALGVVLVPGLSAEPRAQVEPTSEENVPGPGEAALRVTIDPETGALAPGGPSTKAMAPGLQKMLSRSTTGLREVVRPDGSAGVDLQGRFMSASIARLDANGKVETTCVEDAEAAAAFLHGESGGCAEHATPTDPAGREVK